MPHAAMAMIVEAIRILTSDTLTRRPSSPPRRLRRNQNNSPAFTSAASPVPSARPAYPSTRTSVRLSTTFTTIAVMLIATGVRLSFNA